jgi:hypothetical protein
MQTLWALAVAKYQIRYTIDSLFVSIVFDKAGSYLIEAIIASLFCKQPL